MKQFYNKCHHVAKCITLMCCYCKVFSDMLSHRLTSQSRARKLLDLACRIRDKDPKFFQSESFRFLSVRTLKNSAPFENEDRLYQHIFDDCETIRNSPPPPPLKRRDSSRSGVSVCALIHVEDIVVTCDV